MAVKKRLKRSVERVIFGTTANKRKANTPEFCRLLILFSVFYSKTKIKKISTRFYASVFLLRRDDEFASL